MDKLDHPDLKKGVQTAIAQFSVDSVNSLREVARTAEVKPNTVAASFAAELAAIPEVTKLSKKKVRGEILEKHGRIGKATHTAEPQSKKTAGKTKRPAEVVFERAMEWRRLKTRLKALATERDSVRKTVSM